MTLLPPVSEASAPPIRKAAVPPAETPPPPQRPSRWRWIPWVLVRLLALAAAVAAWHYRDEWLPKAKAFLIREETKPTKPAARAVAVVAAPAKQRDLNLYLNGLGTVTAFNTVTIRSRVDGELINVAFDEGQFVTEGDLLAEIDGREYEVQLEEAEGQLARDEATLDAAKLVMARYEKLLPTKSVTQQEFDEHLALMGRTEGVIRTDRALVANAKLQLSYCRIVAPISGRIGLRHVDKGNIIRANDMTGMAVITQLQPISLMFTIPQDDIVRVQRRLHSESESKMEVAAFDRDFKTKLAVGHLDAIDNQVDPLTGTVKLKAEFENDESTLFPNQFVNARLLVETKQNAIVVPSAAVQRGPGSPYVYVLKEDDTVELRNVTIGPAEGTETSIESGLTAGELVVVEGLDKLQPGAKVATRDKEKKAEAEGAKQSEAAPKEASK